MAIERVQAYFMAKEALRSNRVTTKEFTALVGLRLMDAVGTGRSIQALQRYCEAHGHSWHYRNFKPLIDRLIAMGYVARNGRRVMVTSSGALLINAVDRRIKGVITG